MDFTRERDEEIIAVLTGISVISRRLARNLMRLHAAPRPVVYGSHMMVKNGKDGKHDTRISGRR